MQQWGTCVIYPMANVREDLRAAIQIASDAELKIIYRYIGWNLLRLDAVSTKDGAIVKAWTEA